MPRAGQKQTSRRRPSRSIPPRLSLPRPSYKKELAAVIEEHIAPWLTDEQIRYIHPCGASDPFLALTLPSFTVCSSYDNLFQATITDAYKAHQKWLTGCIAVAICVSYMLLKIYEFPGPLPVQILKSWIKIPTFPANVRIYRDTAIVVIISYALLLDINLSYIWLCIFPLIAIGFIYSLSRELGHSVEHHDKHVINSSGEPNNSGEATKEPEELEFIVMAPFCALCVLCVMAYLDSRAADRFAVSQFLLFLSSTLGVLTRMMIRLPAGASPDVTPALELLQKSFLLLLMVTVHTVAAEALGEDVVLVCMPELVPVFLWFSVHLDHESPVITIDKIKPHKNVLIAFGVVPAIAFLAYLANSMDESGLSSCTAIILACGVSGLLTYYVVFMLHQWPGQQPSLGSNIAVNNIGLEDTCHQSEKQVGKDRGTTTSSEAAVQSEQLAGSSEEAVQLLMLWANVLLIAAAAFLLLKYVVACRLGLQEPLVDILCQNLKLC